MYKLGKTYTYASPSFKQEPTKAHCRMLVVPSSTYFSTASQGVDMVVPPYPPLPTHKMIGTWWLMP